MKHGRTDNNQKQIVKALRQIPGVSVYVLSDAGHGFPDLAVGYRGVTTLMEVKEGNAKLTPLEEVFHRSWQGRLFVVRNVDEALKAAGVENK